MQRRAPSAVTRDEVRRRVGPRGFAPAGRQKNATESVDGLVLWLAPASPIANRAALTSLVWRRYVPKSYRDGYSFRAIAKETGSSRSTLSHVAEWLDDEAEGIELRALRRLEETFVPRGVCGAMATQT